MDFLSDKLFDGSKISVLAIVDAYSRLSLAIDVRSKCEAYRREYNEERPHSAIGNKTPVEFMKAIGQPSQPVVQITGSSASGRSNVGGKVKRMMH